MYELWVSIYNVSLTDNICKSDNIANLWELMSVLQVKSDVR